MSVDAASAYRAIVGGEWDMFPRFVADTAEVAVPGNIGTGPDHLQLLMERVRAKGLRTWSPNSADVLASEHHVVVLDRWLTDDGLDEHVTVLLAARDTDGAFGIVSIYGFDAHAIEQLFT